MAVNQLQLVASNELCYDLRLRLLQSEIDNLKEEKSNFIKAARQRLIAQNYHDALLLLYDFSGIVHPVDISYIDAAVKLNETLKIAPESINMTSFYIQKLETAAFDVRHFPVENFDHALTKYFGSDVRTSSKRRRLNRDETLVDNITIQLELPKDKSGPFVLNVSEALYYNGFTYTISSHVFMVGKVTRKSVTYFGPDAKSRHTADFDLPGVPAFIALQFLKSGPNGKSTVQTPIILPFVHMDSLNNFNVSRKHLLEASQISGDIDVLEYANINNWTMLKDVKHYTVLADTIKTSVLLFFKTATR
jgi:hypothetical protein